jgi:hypothetical protein
MDCDPVFPCEMQTVFPQHGFDFKLKANVHQLKNFPDLRVTNLVIAHIVKVDFVDGATSGNN